MIEGLKLADGWSVDDCRSDVYNLPAFARDDFPRFLSLVDLLSPRDQEIMLCFALLQKRPTDLSILFGKAGHRAEEDLHKAAHKLAGLTAFGSLPTIETIHDLLAGCGISQFGLHSVAAALWQYARCRDFKTLARLVGPGFRQHCFRVFKILHANGGREEGLLAGWILWLVDHSNPTGRGWKQPTRGPRNKLGPTTFRTFEPELESSRRASQRGGQGQRSNSVQVRRKMKFLLRSTNA
jgi:hypothetical protein